MSDTTASLRRKIGSAGDLQSVVRTMKALAASSIGQYEQSVRALGDYYRTVELGLGVCFRKRRRRRPMSRTDRADARVRSAPSCSAPTRDWWASSTTWWPTMRVKTLAALPGTPRVWAVGERVHARLADAGPAAGRALRRAEFRQGHHPAGRPDTRGERGAPSPREDRRAPPLLQPPRVRGGLCARQPAAAAAGRQLAPQAGRRFPGRRETCPRSWAAARATLRALIREYLFVSLFRACAESLASENASRLAAMQRADKNIDELLEASTGPSTVCARAASTRSCST